MEAEGVRRLLRDVDARAGDVLAAHRDRVALVRAALEGVVQEESAEHRERVLRAAGELLEEATNRLEDRLRTDVLSEALERLSRELPPERRERIRRQVREGRRE